jgi:folylpolyglutamate synthase/dihydropteroate synthase
VVFARQAEMRWPEVLASLRPHVRAVIATRVGRRGAPVAEVAAAVGGRVPVEAVDDPRAALRTALARARPEDAVLVTGSLFLVGEAYAMLAPAATLFEPWHGWGQ